MTTRSDGYADGWDLELRAHWPHAGRSMLLLATDRGCRC